MKKVIVASCLVALAGALAMAQTETGKRILASTMASGAQRSAVNDFHNPLPKEAKKRMEAAWVPSTKATDNARRLLTAGKLTEAESECLRAIARSPKLNGQVGNGEAVHLLGKIYLAQGRNQEALQTLLGHRRNTQNGVPDLDVALAYCRLGNLEMARKCYSDQAIFRYSSTEPNELPGTKTAKALEASILLALGLDAALTCEYEDARQNFDAASKLAPQNGLTAYMMAENLRDLNRREEAASYYRIAAQYGRGEHAKEAKRLTKGYDFQEALKKAKRDGTTLPDGPNMTAFLRAQQRQHNAKPSHAP